MRRARFRRSLRGRELLAATVLAVGAVATATGFHLAHLGRLVVEDANREAELLANEVYALVRVVAARAPAEDLSASLAGAPELAALLDADTAFSSYLVSAAIVDADGRGLVESGGGSGAHAPALSSLLELGPIERLRTLLGRVEPYRHELALAADGVPVGSVRFHVAPGLLRAELMRSIRTGALLALLSLPVAWIVALGASELTLRSVRTLETQLARLRPQPVGGPDPAREPSALADLATQLSGWGVGIREGHLAALAGAPVAHAEDAATAPVEEPSDADRERAVRALVHYGAAMARQTRQVASVVHEVRNPLNAMQLHLELLRQSLDAPPEAASKSLDVIGEQVTTLAQRVQDFLRAARPEAMERNPVNLGTLVEGVVALVAPEARTRGIKLGATIAEPDLVVEGDAERLREALLNLVRNGMEALGDAPGSVRLRVRAEGPFFARITVTDSGPGIPADSLEKIFDLYYTTKDSGTGVGLFLVRRIVEQHAGTLTAANLARGGARFTLRLPLSEPSTGTAAELSSPDRG